MPVTRKALALAVSLVGLLTVVTIAQSQKPGTTETQLSDVEATVDWFQKSDVSAFREGVIKTMELRIGSEVANKGDIIGYLHKEVADLAVKEAEIMANSQGAILKAEAQKKLAISVVGRNQRLINKDPRLVSQEDVEKALAEFAAADASLIEAHETQQLAQAKHASAVQVAEEHIIRAPFAGQILKEMKHEGESVRANEPVVQLGNLDTVRVWAYIPLEYAYRVKPGTEIVIQPKLGGTSGKHSIESRQFRGVIKSVDQSIQPIAETAVRIYADLDNADHQLRPGLKAKMTIFFKPETATSFNSSPNPGNQVSNTAPTSARARPVELPPLPR